VLPTNGSPTNVSTPSSGQGAYLTFTAAAGQSLSLAVTNLVVTGGSYARIGVYDPNGTYVTGTTCFQPSCELALTNLGIAGTYSVAVTQQPGMQGVLSLTATLSVDASGSLTQGTAFNVNLPTLGESALLTFTATANQSVTLTVSSIVTTPPSTTEYITVYNAAGTAIASGSGTTSASIPLSNLAAGQYSVLITPASPATGSMQVKYQ
jgi:trimeric autotransporter adhesin